MIPIDSENASNAYDVLRPLMTKFGATCSPEQFYWAVSETYHAAESKRYDAIHSDMFEEEEMVWKRLLGMLPSAPKTLMLLDVGCGTGLVGHFVSTICPHRVGAMHLLDPSREMLDVVREKAQGWPFETVLHHGDILSLSKDLLFNVVTINSVLHHVVDLESFLRKVQDAIRPGGFLLTGFDPRSGVGNDPVLQERKESVRKRLEKRVSLPCKIRCLIAPTIKRMFRIERHGTLTMATNRPLLERGVIKRSMDNKTIWAITNFHMPGQPGKFGKGICVKALNGWMPSMELIVTLTYHYHDAPWPALTEAERQQERRLWMANDPHDAEMALVWQKRPC